MTGGRDSRSGRFDWPHPPPLLWVKKADNSQKWRSMNNTSCQSLACVDEDKEVIETWHIVRLVEKQWKEMESGNEDILSVKLLPGITTECRNQLYLFIFSASKRTSFQDRIWELWIWIWDADTGHWFEVTTWVMETIDKTPVAGSIQTVGAVGQEQ